MDMFHFVKEYHNNTTVHPLGLVALALAIAGIFLAPRRYALIPFILIACIIAPAQRVVVFGLDFTFLRLLTTVAWIRIIAHGENRGFTFTLIDKVMVVWVLFTLAISPLRSPSAAMVVYNLGVAFDAIGTYFLVRFLVRTREDVIGLATGAALISVPIAMAMLYERLTGVNSFSIFGGVPEQTIERFGRYRAQAAFAHPIVAGVFWASLLPLILAGLRRRTESFILTAIGILGTLVIVWCCSSSTPVHLIGLVTVSCVLFTVRWTLPWIRGGIIGSLLVLHIVMFQPVWHLFARINFFHGSTGWWRYLIIDTFVTNWDQWIVAGTSNSAQWLSGGMYADVTNEYVLEGIDGGITKLALFLAILFLAFYSVRKAMRRVERSEAPRSSGVGSARGWMPWCIGISMAVHAAAYFATGYFGQLIFMQFLSLGIAASLVSVVPSMKRVAVFERSGGDLDDERQADPVALPTAPGAAAVPAAPAAPAPAPAPIPPALGGTGWRPSAPGGSPLFKPV